MGCRPAAALALMAAGADVSVPCGEAKQSVVHIAARDNYAIEILKVAIELGADVNIADGNSNTPLHLAAMCNTAEAVDVLVEAGANTEAGESPEPCTLHLATNRLNHEALLILLKHGADVDVRDGTLRTLLHCAAIRAGTEGAAEVVESLSRSGADETFVNAEGEVAADVVRQ